MISSLLRICWQIQRNQAKHKYKVYPPIRNFVLIMSLVYEADTFETDRPTHWLTDWLNNEQTNEGSLSSAQQPTTSQYSEPDKFSPCHPNLFVYTQFAGDFFPSVFSTKTQYTFLFSSIRVAMFHLFYPPWFDHPNNNWCAMHSTMFLIMAFSPT